MLVKIYTNYFILINMTRIKIYFMISIPILQNTEPSYISLMPG